ncbi:MAG: hypothetical protein K9G76_06455 [Bacteroidales bacterium]|nr:hypothetical protein [Bacteroidales bacterium]MCF8402329.1 hypothetical protein [Bacteroidales bacterium]
MYKTFIFICYLQAVSVAGCGPEMKSNNEEVNKIIVNGSKLVLSVDQNKELSELVLQTFKQCDEFYELLITENLISSIRSGNSYLEIIFYEPQVIETNQYGKQKFSQILIPLSGKYTANGQVSFFSGTDNFSNTPFINTEGFDKIEEMLKKFE